MSSKRRRSQYTGYTEGSSMRYLSGGSSRRFVRPRRALVSAGAAGLVRTTGSYSAPLATRGFAFNTGRFGGIKEKKFFDIAATIYSFDTTGTVTLLSAPIQGTDYTNRIGRKIMLKSVYVRGFCGTETSATVTAPVVAPAQIGRLILLIDMQPNGTLPAMTDILMAATPISHLNPNNRDRFKILFDKQYVFGRTAIDTTATQTYAFQSDKQAIGIKKYKKINVEQIFNSGNAGTIADTTSGALLMITIGNIAAGTNTNSFAWVTTRVRFLDP